MFVHAKDVETNCTKVLRLCLSTDSPYKSFYQNNGTYPSGQNWFDYAKWIHKAMHQLIAKSDGTKDFDVEDPSDVCNNSDDEDVMDDVEYAKEDQTKSQKKKTPTKKRQVKIKEETETTIISTMKQSLIHPLIKMRWKVFFIPR